MADFCACDEFAMDDSPDSFGFISADAPFPIPITLGGTGAANSEVAAMNIIGPLSAVNALDEYDKVLIQQNSTAAIRKRRADAFAQDMWDMLYKDAEPIEDSTAPITSGAVYQALGGIFSPVKYATPGALVHIEDGGYNQPVQGMKIAINPVQSGEGDPSPDNVRPISGWTAAGIARTGSNLISPFNGTYTSTSSGVTYTFAGANVTINGTSTGANADSANMDTIAPIILKAGRTYTFAISGNWTTPNLRLILKDIDRNILWFGDSTRCQWTVTPETDLTVQRVQFRVRSAGLTFNNVSGAFYCNLNALGAYEPYKGTTYEVSFSSAGTVYGGTLTYNGDGTWTLEVHWFGLCFDTAEKIALLSTYTDRRLEIRETSLMSYIPYPRIKSASTQLCSHAKYQSNAGSIHQDTIAEAQFQIYPTNGRIYFAIPGVDSLQGYKDFATEQMTAGTPLTFVSLVAESQYATYQLTGPEVLTLLGINNFWADCGEIEEFAYRADIGLYLTAALNPIKEMLAYREDTMRATRNYTTGDYIIVGDTFYRAAVPIANGAILTPGTNVNATTVGAQLKLLS